MTCAARRTNRASLACGRWAAGRCAGHGRADARRGRHPANVRSVTRAPERVARRSPRLWCSGVCRVPRPGGAAEHRPRPAVVPPNRPRRPLAGRSLTSCCTSSGVSNPTGQRPPACAGACPAGGRGLRRRPQPGPELADRARLQLREELPTGRSGHTQWPTLAHQRRRASRRVGPTGPVRVGPSRPDPSPSRPFVPPLRSGHQWSDARFDWNPESTGSLRTVSHPAGTPDCDVHGPTSVDPSAHPASA